MTMFTINDSKSGDFVQTRDYYEQDCDLCVGETYETNLGSWYKLEVNYDKVRTCEGQSWATHTVAVVYDHPEDGYYQVAFGASPSFQDEATTRMVEDFERNCNYLSLQDRIAMWHVFERYLVAYN